MTIYIELPGGYGGQGPSCSGGSFTVPPKPSYAPVDSTLVFIVDGARTAGPVKYDFVFRGVPAK